MLDPQMGLGHGVGVSAAWVAFALLLHYLGLAAGFGGAGAVQRLTSAAREHSAAQRAGIEIAARKLAVNIELPAMFLAILGGIILLVQNPNHLKPAASGAGPWLHLKLLLVLGALILSHLRMFRLSRLVRARADGASEAECDALLGAARRFGGIALLLYVATIFVATFRFVLFG